MLVQSHGQGSTSDDGEIPLVDREILLPDQFNQRSPRRRLSQSSAQPSLQPATKSRPRVACILLDFGRQTVCGGFEFQISPGHIVIQSLSQRCRGVPLISAKQGIPDEFDSVMRIEEDAQFAKEISRLVRGVHQIDEKTPVAQM